MSKKYNWNHLSIICFIVIIITGGCGDGGGGGDTENTSATLSWDAPTTNTDGELTDVVGYKVYYGTSPGNYYAVIDAGDVTTYTINNLSPATYYFAVTAYDEMGNESSYSNEVSKTAPQ